MKFSWPLFFMAVGLAIHTLNDLSGTAPATWKPYISHSTEVLTAVAGWRCLFINPDGTSAKAAWTPEQK